MIVILKQLGPNYVLLSGVTTLCNVTRKLKNTYETESSIVL